jgi:hypothetical protein
MAKYIFFVDGFNLYHALDYTHTGPDHFKYRKFKWLNLQKLASLYVGRLDTLEKVILFTAFATWDPAKVARHKLFVRANESVGVQVVYGELHPTVAAMLRDFIGDRTQGFLFRTRAGTPFLQSNFLRSSLYPILEELGIEKQGFHGFRRFRVTHLESSCVPPALVKYWTGHAQSSDGEVVRQTVTDKYIKMEKDTKFRAEVAEQIGLGFELPQTERADVVPSVPSFQETGVSVSI